MSKRVLTHIASAFADMGIEYGFMQYGKNPIVYPYFVGDYSDINQTEEDGMQEGNFRLIGFSRDTWETLETARTKIENRFDPVCGDIKIYEDGSCTAVFYGGSQTINTLDAELKRISITLQVKEWKVN